MNQIFAAGAAFVLAGILWGLGKKPNFFRSSIINREGYIEPKSLSIDKKSLKLELGTVAEESESPFNLNRIQLRKKIFDLIKLGPEERLEAVEMASNWGHSSVLPILKMGLRDTDGRVVLVAAEGIKKFRTTSSALNLQGKVRPPRNVFLMR